MDKYFIGAILVSSVVPGIIFLIFLCLFLAFAFPLVIWGIPILLTVLWEAYFWSKFD